MQTYTPTNLEHAAGAKTKSAPVADYLTRNGLQELVRTRPMLAFAGAGIVGATLGGLLFPRLGRLMFLAVAGYAASGLLQRQRELDVDEVIGRRPGRGERNAV